MSHITTEQALQIPQQLQRQGSQHGSGTTAHSGNTEDKQNKAYLTDDAVTLQHIQSGHSLKKVKVENYKYQLGQENALVRETLRTKLAEYNLNPNTQLSVSKDPFGNVEIKGALLQSDIDRLSEDLNNNTPFKAAFNQLNQHQPTLNYVDNVVKLSDAYGVTNNLFNTLISDDSEFNGLNDISHRYQAMKASTDQNPNLAADQGYQFVLNA